MTGGTYRTAFSACPLCSGQAFSPLRTADVSKHPLYHHALPATVEWVKCDGCEHVFTKGYWTPEAFALIAEKTNANQRVGADYERQRWIAARMVEKVIAQLPEPNIRGEWLDVGFGNGALLLTAQEFGFEPIGIDVRQENVEDLRKLGVQAHMMNEYVDPPIRACVVSMCDVLEHTHNPIHELNAARAHMQVGGRLFISAPNMDTALWRMLDAQSVNPYWAEIEHIHNFTRQSLYALLDKAGFRAMSYGVSERYRCGMEIIACAKS